MLYLGMDVHSASTVWCLLDREGEIVKEGSTPTTLPELRALVTKLAADGELLVGQEVGSMAYLVRDAMAQAEVSLLSFNAYHLRMIAASRKKTDRRDAYWIARALQSKMHPHPVYLPTGDVLRLRRLLGLRAMIHRDRLRWQYRARALLRAAGIRTRTGAHYLRKLLTHIESEPNGVDAHLESGIQLCRRQEEQLGKELQSIELELKKATDSVDDIQRLMTIPGVGLIAATTLYAWVGDVTRFPNARMLAAYAGLVPSVRQSGETNRLGHITKSGCCELRAVLVQAAHVLTSRCKSEEAVPLQQIYGRIRGTRGRRKIAIVALARHLLRIAYYILRDETTYQAERVTLPEEKTAA